MDLNYKMILMPLVGAVIGYITNWIAVKMLFHPRKAIYIGSVKLPFTPGVIPKGQGRLAGAVGRMVETQLLTKEVLLSRLNSDKVTGGLKGAVRNKIEELKTREDSLSAVLSEHIEAGALETAAMEVEEAVSGLLHHKIMELDLGSIVAEKVLEAVKEKLANSFFGMMLGESVLMTVAEEIKNKINLFVEEEGKEYLDETVKKEMESLLERPLTETLEGLPSIQIDPETVIAGLYVKLMDEKIEDMLAVIDVSGMVEEKINAMDVKEVEELVLIMMKQELGTIVNLGALIGFVLGLANIFIFKL